jgi:hypothetical protein
MRTSIGVPSVGSRARKTMPVAPSAEKVRFGWYVRTVFDASTSVCCNPTT